MKFPVGFFCAAAVVCAAVLAGCDNKKKEHHDEREAAIALYDWGVGSWEPIPTSPGCPSARTAFAMVYTGSELIIWGGFLEVGPVYTNTGGVYNFENGSWRATSTGPNCPEARYVTDYGYVTKAIWTGSEMIIWGTSNSSHTQIGGIYNPATDTWRTMSDPNGIPVYRSGNAAIWTGDRMIIWGGYTGDNGTGFLCTNTGAIYHTENDSWTTISTGMGCPCERIPALGVWDGNRMLIWGGKAYNQVFWNGAYYYPDTDTWETIDSDCPYSQDLFGTDYMVHTGNEILIWHSSSYGVMWSTGFRYEIDTDTWSYLSLGNSFEESRNNFPLIWTGSKMIIWGGSSNNNFSEKTGYLYDPVTDTYEKTYYGPGTPEPRYWHLAIWTGESMIIWGGYGTSGPINTGGIFTP
ncbi:MAG: Kelch repeat-containing protein [Planctomycetota bacterium]|jgi:hypothetical protein